MDTDEKEKRKMKDKMNYLRNRKKTIYTEMILTY